MRQLPIRQPEMMDGERVARLKQWALCALGLVVMVSLVYVPLQGLGVLPGPVEDAAMTIEASLSAAFFPELESISAQYVVPFLARLVVTGALIGWLLRSYISK